MTAPPGPRPSTLRACLAFASDPEGIEAAEWLAAIAAARLAPWHYPGWPGCRGDRPPPAPPPRPERWIWRTIPFQRDQGSIWRDRSGHLSPILMDAVDRASQIAGLKIDLWRSEAGSRAWDLLAARGAVVPPYGRSRPFPPRWRLLGRPFASLDSPFEPLRGIWDAGYMLEKLEDGAGYLVAAAAF